MANYKMKVLLQEGTHEVGVLNSSQSRDIVNGAKLTGGDLDNFLLVEDAGWDEDGRLCKALSDNTKKGFLVTTIEEESLYADEEFLQGNYRDFYNAEGEFVRMTLLEAYVTRFETSAFELNSGVDKATRGMVAHYDATKKKYIISKSANDAEAGYATAKNQFEVVDVETDFGFNVGHPNGTIRLEAR